MHKKSLGNGLVVTVEDDKVKIVQYIEHDEDGTETIHLLKDDLEKIIKAVFKDEVEALEKIDETLHDYYTADALDVQDLFDYKSALEEAGEKLHWSHLVGRDLISDYVAEETANIDKDLEELGISNL